jgi:hypothetical protein
MAHKFTKLDFPSTVSVCRDPERAGASEKSQQLKNICSFVVDLSKKAGDNAVEAGIVKMVNDWNSSSTFKTSLNSIESGLLGSGADAKAVAPILDKFRSEVASKTVLKLKAGDN